MPHQCTDCGRQFDDGSKEMLSGCPDCGGAKFQFLPDGHADADPPTESPSVEEPGSSVARTVGSAATAVRDFVGSSSRTDRPDSPDRPPTPESDSGTESQTPATQTEPTQQSETPTDPPSSGRPSRSDSGRSPNTTDGLREPEPASMQTPDSENDAQASARSEVIASEELPPKPEQSGWEATTPAPQTTSEPEPEPPERTERPDLSELRAELNQQFESIKVLEPGQYELNLMELFDREEYIVALQEDGKYTVQVPEHWQE